MRASLVPGLVRRQWLLRILLVWLVEMATLATTARLLPGLDVDGWPAAIWGVAAIGLLNAGLRPVLLLLTQPLTALTFGVSSLALNAVSILLAARVVPGMTVAGWWAALAATLALAAANTLMDRLLALDDEDSFYRNVVRRLAARRARAHSGEPGLIMLEIDGLSRRSLERALRDGYMPTLARWLASGSHRMVGWDCGVPSQTSSSHAGILWGDSFDIPAFRWFEKENGRLIVSSRTADAAAIERRIRGEAGLLIDGSSLCNMFSGGAARSILTVSTVSYLGAGVRRRAAELHAYFLNPYNFSRAMVLMVWEVAVESWSATWGALRGVTPRVSRGGTFPFIRAVSTVLLRDIAAYLVIEDMFAGVPVNYATFVGYDVVAHYAGVESPDALRVLRGIDERFAKIERTARRAQRPYRIVVLSDHGQSEGATFRARYGIALEELIQALPHGTAPVRASIGSDETRSHVDALKAEVLPHAAPLDRAAPEAEPVPGGHRAPHDVPAASGAKEIVVCASGNLALVYFTAWTERATLEQIVGRFPHVLDGLVSHEGVGFVLVRTAGDGPVVLGRSGRHFLASGRIVGEDPLATFGSRAREHLLRLDSFPHVGDIVVNGMVAADGSIAAFEEQLGSHGGLGGAQNDAFLIHPADVPLETGDIVGPEAIHRILRGWAPQRTRGTSVLPGPLAASAANPDSWALQQSDLRS